MRWLTPWSFHCDDKITGNSELTLRLKQAIEGAYSSLGSRSLGSRLDVCHCPCCMTLEMAHSIVSTPLRNLSNEQLCEYSNSAHEWLDQLLYLLPRYMELVAHGQWPSDIDAGHILSRFRYAPEPCMSSLEVAAFDEWLLTLFESTLMQPY